jgi:hypothetical protein
VHGLERAGLVVRGERGAVPRPASAPWRRGKHRSSALRALLEEREAGR